MAHHHQRVTAIAANRATANDHASHGKSFLRVGSLWGRSIGSSRAGPIQTKPLPLKPRHPDGRQRRHQPSC